MNWLAQVTGGRLHGADAVFTAVSTDTRRIENGQLFVALSGPNFDGHRFLAEATAAGAVGALAERWDDDCNLPQVVVEDARLALGQMARAWRQNFDIPLIGVTGSNGKTTVKEMTASILRQRGTVLATRGNLNNDIGVPLTLLEIEPRHSAAVIELGANHPGEIDYLAGLALPTIGVVSNAGPAHLEGFGSVEGVARAKGELFTALGPAGVAVINADDRFAALWQSMCGRRQQLRFGLDAAAEFAARDLVRESNDNGVVTRFTLQSMAGERALQIPFVGRHNVANALAATAVAWAAGASLDEIEAGLAVAKSVSGRLQLRPASGGAIVIDDSYNANPESLKAALAVQQDLGREAWLVLGDMGELGQTAAQLHVDAGLAARAAGVTRLFACGEHSRNAVDAFGEGGSWFAGPEALSAAVLKALRPNVSILVKASRSMRFENVVASLLEPSAEPQQQVNGG